MSQPDSELTSPGQSDPPDSRESAPAPPENARDTTAPRNPESPSTEDATADTDTSVPAKSPAEQLEDALSAGQEPLENQLEDQPTVISKPDSSDGPTRDITSQDLGAALVGTVLEEKYRLEEFVGGGGMGAVFRATDVVLNRAVAVKVMARGLDNDELVKRFLNEAQSAARLDHDNIARVHYVSCSSGWHFIVFEYVEGINVRDYVMGQGPLPLSEAVSITLQVAQALDHAWQRHVVHRDIKPSNLILAADGRVKLVDMGLARLSRVDAADPDLTASGVTMGTFDYVSPEQANDPRNTDVRSDLYSLGCTLFFMLTGRPPFAEGNAVNKLIQHREARRPDPRTHQPNVPADMARIVRKLMAARPKNRYQTPADLIADLLILAEQVGVDVTSRGAIRVSDYLRGPTWWQRILPVAVPALILVAVLVGLEIFYAIGDRTVELTEPRFAPAILEPAPEPDRQPPEPPSTDTEPGKAAPTSANTREPTEADLRAVATATQRLFAQAAAAGNVAGDGTRREPESGDPDREMPEIPVAVTEIVITDDATEERRDVDTLVLRSLPQALIQLESLPLVERIVLDFDGPRTLPPLPMMDRNIAIEAAPGATPQLVFAPVDQMFPSMAVVVGSRVEWRGIDFVFRVPPLITTRNWSLFRVQRTPQTAGQEQLLQFEGCTVTVISEPTGFVLTRPSASLIEVTRPEKTEFEKGGARYLAEPPMVRLERCAVRGQLNLVNAPEVTPLVIDWDQGLFVSDRRLIETGGTIKQPIAFRVHVMLDQVTVASRPGLMRMKTSSPNFPVQLQTMLNFNRCIFLSDPGANWIEYVGVGRENPAEYLILEGTNNCLPDDGVFWSFRDNSGGSDRLDWDIEQAAEQLEWFRFTVVERTTRVRWQSPVPDGYTLPHEVRVADFQLDDDASNPGLLQQAGFDPASVPEFPELRSAPATAPGDGEAGDVRGASEETTNQPDDPPADPAGRDVTRTESSLQADDPPAAKSSGTREN